MRLTAPNNQGSMRHPSPELYQTISVHQQFPNGMQVFGRSVIKLARTDRIASLQEGSIVPESSQASRRGVPLYVRILIGAALGTLAGILWPRKVGWLGDIGILVITLLKTLATPLILFAVLDAFLKTRIPAQKGAKLVAISLVNATVAIVIGLTVANVLHSGDRWRGQIEPLKREIEQASSTKSKKEVDEDQERVEGLIDTARLEEGHLYGRSEAEASVA